MPVIHSRRLMADVSRILRAAARGVVGTEVRLAVQKNPLGRAECDERLEDGALAADYAGVRPKLRPPSDGAADFCLLADGATLHLLGVESPGLTASLALADEAADAALGLPRR